MIHLTKTAIRDGMKEIWNSHEMLLLTPEIRSW